MKQNLIIISLSIVIGLIGGYFLRGLFVPKNVVTPQVEHFVGKPDSVSSKPDSIIVLTKYLPSKPDTVKIQFVAPASVQGDAISPKVTHYTSYKTFKDSLGTYDIIGYALAPIDSIALTVIHFNMKTVTVLSKNSFLYGFGTGIAFTTILIYLLSHIIK